MNSRQQTLRRQIETRGHIDISEAARHFEVSEMTIRRDISLLEKNGYAVAVKGGAIPKAKICDNAQVSPAKESIAIYMLELIKQMPNIKTLLLSTGSTTLALAKQIAESRLALTIITNSIPIASALFQTPAKVILTGGELRNTSLDLVGPAAEKYLSEYNVDLLITGCDGADAQEGFYTSDLNLANYEKLCVKISEKVFILTESCKFKRRAFAQFAELKDVNCIVTDNKLQKLDREFLTRSGIEIFQS